MFTYLFYSFFHKHIIDDSVFLLIFLPTTINKFTQQIVILNNSKQFFVKISFKQFIIIKFIKQYKLNQFKKEITII